MKLVPTFSENKNKNWFRKPVVIVLSYHFYKRQDTKRNLFRSSSLIIFTDLNNIPCKKKKNDDSKSNTIRNNARYEYISYAHIQEGWTIR